MTAQTQDQTSNTAQQFTQGVHHIGLTVKDLPTTLLFFESALRFKKVGEAPDYPAAFVSDGNIMIALWQALAEDLIEFDRKANIGLHHLALNVEGEESLHQLHEKLSQTHGVCIEFAPEPLHGGPTQHMMITEPGGIRLEFIAPMK